ncbi:MAG: SDR family oxidoreductase [Flavobacteriales bacterium]|nr:SDR family oxidoreductase [Flavobacteriales bacterium]
MDNQIIKFSQEEWDACMKVLESLVEDPLNNPDNDRFKNIISKISKKAKKQLAKQKTINLDKEWINPKKIDNELISSTTIITNAKNNASYFTHSDDSRHIIFTELKNPKRCYICHNLYNQLHFFYHKLCLECATLNYANRSLGIELSGKTAIVTGGRIKVGFATALRLLRCNARVVVTTRFPGAAWSEFSKESDFAVWKDRLIIYGLDLRNLKAVYDFVEFCKNQLECLDILINNAAQTIKYPIEYYSGLISKEVKNIEAATIMVVANSTPIQKEANKFLPELENFPQTKNRFGQPIDYRTKNSWNSKLGEIELEELLEVNLINQISPYLLVSELKPLMIKLPHQPKIIVNVTSSEGQFSYKNKTVFHPHTNMTKAALNMLTKTSASDLAGYNIFMNSVDVGWISTGASEARRNDQFEKLQIPPLDPVDGASRIMHNIVQILNETPEFGCLYKDYQKVDW